MVALVSNSTRREKTQSDAGYSPFSHRATSAAA
jgi:hypothetical protein